MIVRPATPADVPAVLPMVRSIVNFHESLDRAKYAPRGDPAEKYRGWLTQRAIDPRSVFLVAEPSASADRDASPLAGFLVGSTDHEIPIYQIEEFGMIHDLWVEERYRNEGIARQMVTLAIERFAAIGVRQMRLHAAWDNAPARALFTTCGFRPSSVEMLLELAPANT